MDDGWQPADGKGDLFASLDQKGPLEYVKGGRGEKIAPVQCSWRQRQTDDRRVSQPYYWIRREGLRSAVLYV